MALSEKQKLRPIVMEWKRMDEDWAKELWFSEQLLHSFKEYRPATALLFERSRRKEGRHCHIKWEGKMDNKLKIRFSKIHRKGGFKGSWTSKFLWKKNDSHSLSTCCNMRMRSHTKEVKALHYETIWCVAIRKVVLSLVNINPSSGFQKAALCDMFAVKLQYYRMEKKMVSIFPEVMGSKMLKSIERVELVVMTSDVDLSK